MNREETTDHFAKGPMPVEFRCICGNSFDIDGTTGGECDQCKRSVTPAMLSGSLSATFSLPRSAATLGKTAVVDPGQLPLARSTVSGELAAGSQLGHFEIVSRLGSGGMAQVYRALDHSLQRYVAVKVLKSRTNPLLSESDSEMDRLLQEAVAQARVPHPNVVPIYYVGRHEGSPFLAMELVAGQTLQQRVAQTEFEFREIVSTAAQLADALRFARALDLIHGDIKPSNVLVQDGGLVKLSDFGMARSATNDDGTPVGGTPNYLAPELLVGGKPTVQSDIYALGVTLYEMTFGSLPVQLNGTTMDEWAESHRIASIRFPKIWPESIPETWGRILSRMLSADPSVRYQDYESLLADLFRIIPSTSPVARWLPRVIAGMIDYGAVLFSTLSVFLIGSLGLSLLAGYWNLADSSLWSLLHDDAPWYIDIGIFFTHIFFYCCLFLPVIGHTMLMGSWRTSIGRKLMHVAVVNRYGLKPTRKLALSREFFRLLFAWIVPICSVLAFGVNWPLVANLLLVAGLVFVLVNTAFLVITPTGKTLHDRWFHTRAVLETN